MPATLDAVATDAAPAAFAEAVARAEAGTERIILTRAGRPVAAVVPLADLEAIEDAEDEAAAAEGLAEYAQSGTEWPVYTVEELTAQWGIASLDDQNE